MATIEEWFLADQIKQVLHRWPSSMRDNATAYKSKAQRVVDATTAANQAKATAGSDTAANAAADILIAAAAKAGADLVKEINGDADLFLTWIGRLESLASRNLTLFTGALSALGHTVNQANTLKNILKSAAQALKDATKTTQAEINSAADALLAAVPNFERIF